MTELPDPLVPAEVDLQDFPFMPLMVTRLRKSKAWVKARRNPALGFYMLNLWMSAWHEVPAGSLEDDDDVLADAAICDPSKWSKVRDDVLRGWVKCADGRLYHPVVGERVMDAWASKVERRERTDHERDRKRIEREERARLFEKLKSAGIHKHWNTSLTDLRKAVHDLSGGQAPDSPKPVHDLSRLREGEGYGDGEGERYGQGEGVIGINVIGGPQAASPVDPPAAPPPPAAEAAATRKTAERGTRLSCDFELPKTWGDWALAEYPRWTPEKVRHEAAAFRDFWCSKTGKDATKLDWQATWRNWCRSHIAQRGDVNGPPGASQTTTISAGGAQTLRNAAAAAERIFGAKEETREP